MMLLLLLVPVLSQAFFSFVSGDLVPFSLFTAWHKYLTYVLCTPETR